MSGHPCDRVREALAAAGIKAEILEFPQGTRTAADAARAVGTTLGQIVKSLLFIADGRAVLVLASGKNRVSEAKLAGLLKGARIERADAARVREETGFVIGGVPPVGHPSPIETVVDEELLRYDIVYAAAGTPTTVFPASPAELLRATGGRAADVAQPQ